MEFLEESIACSPLYSRKLHILVRLASTSWVTSFTILFFVFAGRVWNHFASLTFPSVVRQSVINAIQHGHESRRTDPVGRRAWHSWAFCWSGFALMSFNVNCYSSQAIFCGCDDLGNLWGWSRVLMFVYRCERWYSQVCDRKVVYHRYYGQRMDLSWWQRARSRPLGCWVRSNIT